MRCAAVCWYLIIPTSNAVFYVIAGALLAPGQQLETACLQFPAATSSTLLSQDHHVVHMTHPTAPGRV